MRLDVLYLTFHGWVTCWQQPPGKYDYFCYINRSGKEVSMDIIKNFSIHDVLYKTNFNAAWLFRKANA